jgi:hypothetical protein
MVNVTKADGTSQPFEKGKIVRTCIRMHATPEIAEEIASRVEKNLYEGIPTKKIFQMVFAYLKRYRPELKGTKDLRTATSLLRPKPDFEQFVAHLMQAEGYNVKTNRILQGACVDHEIDVIAEKSKEIIYIEVKHHAQPHIYTGLDVFLETNSAFEDLKSGFSMGRHGTNFNKSMVVINTKISDHAKRYSTCQGIGAVAWKTPAEKSLEDMIEDHKMFPITILKGLDVFAFAKLADRGIVTLKQLVKADEISLHKETKIPLSVLEESISKAREMLTSW